MSSAAGLRVSAGVATAALLAVASVLIPLAEPGRHPEPQLHDIRLTAGSQDVLDAQLEINSSLINEFFNSNHDLVETQRGLTPELTALLGGQIDPDGTPHGLAKDAVEQFFNANNALVGADQAALLGLLGARGTMTDGTFTPLSLEDLNESLLVDPQHQGSIPFAGLQSAIGHYIGAAVFLQGFLSGASGSDIENSAGGAGFGQLVADVTAFNTAVLAAEKAFGNDLVAGEVDLERAVFGTDSAYNGVINRAFNAVNMMYDAQQQSFNGLLGLTGYDPQDYTSALLTGSGGAAGQIFNDGSVGGLPGMVDQLLMMLLDGADVNADSNIPDGFTADPDTVATAFSALMQTLAGGPFGDTFAPGGAFSDLLADAGSLFSAGF